MDSTDDKGKNKVAGVGQEEETAIEMPAAGEHRDQCGYSQLNQGPGRWQKVPAFSLTSVWEEELLEVSEQRSLQSNFSLYIFLHILSEKRLLRGNGK